MSQPLVLLPILSRFILAIIVSSWNITVTVCYSISNPAKK